MKAAPVVLQNTSLFVTMTFQIEEQKEKKKNNNKNNSNNSLSENKQITIISFSNCSIKQVFLAAGLLVGEFNGFVSVH